MESKQAAVMKPQTSALQLSGKSFAFFGEFSDWPYRACEPADMAVELGGVVAYEVTAHLTYMVVGDNEVKGALAKKLAQARKSAEKFIDLAQLAKKDGKSLHCPTIIDESTFKEMVAIDVKGKTFAFFGGFDLCDGDPDAGLLHHMVKSIDAVVAKDVDPTLDYLVLGNIRRPGKTAAQAEAKKLQESGAKVRSINEDRFLELVRTAKPLEKRAGDGPMDFGSFIGHVHAILDTGKLGRALKMLRAESFQLYSRKDDDALLGVVASQTGSGKVYASWLTAHGKYGCATPDLEDCLGLSGDICKHLLVLLIGLVRTNKMDAETAYNWIHATTSKLPGKDIQLVADAFIQYNGAQLGEIDWRPTETIPEDYYAF